MQILAATLCLTGPTDAASKHVFGEPFHHNGSAMTIDLQAGIIVYASLNPAFQRHARRVILLFQGDLSNPGNVWGTAYAFKQGCHTAPYDVRGRFANGYQSTLTLTGRAPVRSVIGCAVTGHSSSSPHARLTFEYDFPPEL